MGFVNSNVLPEFSRELRELPWQPNLGKNKPKLPNFNSLQEMSKYFACKYGVVEFKYAALVLDRAKGVAMATKIIERLFTMKVDQSIE